jgi:UDP-3-O-[3-hydroxymyristoyl] glucosamine N-acyltransferase
MRVSDIAEQLGLAFEGDGGRDIAGVAPLDAAAAEEISFAGGGKALKGVPTSAAGCIVVPLDFENAAGLTVIRAKDPRGAFAKVIRLLSPPAPPSGIHPTAVVGRDCEIGEGVSIGAYSVVGDRVKIGAGSLLHSNVTIYHDVAIGARAVIHSGAVLGADGFGFVMERGCYEKFPQVGRVEIGDDVEIGANCTIDRAALGVTSIGDGTKLDNMVHIAHNCRLGRHVVIAAQTGMAGGTAIHDYAVIGGQVGFGDNVTIESGVVLGSKAGVLPGKTLRGAGTVYWGVPAKPLDEHLKGLAHITRIGRLLEEVAELKARIKEIEKGKP